MELFAAAQYEKYHEFRHLMIAARPLRPWASDASAIAACPALRAPEGLKAPVSIDAILEALCELAAGAAIRPEHAEPPLCEGADDGGPRRLVTISRPA